MVKFDATNHSNLLIQWEPKMDVAMKFSDGNDFQTRKHTTYDYLSHRRVVMSCSLQWVSVRYSRVPVT